MLSLLCVIPMSRRFVYRLCSGAAYCAERKKTKSATQTSRKKFPIGAEFAAGCDQQRRRGRSAQIDVITCFAILRISLSQIVLSICSYSKYVFQLECAKLFLRCVPHFMIVGKAGFASMSSKLATSSYKVA